MSIKHYNRKPIENLLRIPDTMNNKYDYGNDIRKHESLCGLQSKTNITLIIKYKEKLIDLMVAVDDNVELVDSIVSDVKEFYDTLPIYDDYYIHEFFGELLLQHFEGYKNDWIDCDDS